MVRCDGCLMDVSSLFWIHCSVCQIDICPLCVFQGIQIHDHDPAHPYRIAKSLSFEADFPNWQILEELLFVDGTIIHGIGNWEDVAAYVGRKTPAEIKAHFHQVFNLQEDSLFEGPPVTDLHSNPLSQEISGYMPLREDFEVEYHNEAEMAIREMTITKTDTQLEKEMKEALLDGYRQVLLKRQLFRHLVFKKGLLSAKKLLAAEKSLCAAGKDLLQKVKPLLKVLSKDEFVTFFQGVYLEVLLRKKIRSLSSLQSEALKKPEPSRRTAAPTEDLPTSELLSETEQRLCEALSISPSSYLLLKGAAVLNPGTETTRRALGKAIQGLSEYKLNVLTEFFAQNQWIEPETPKISKDKSF